MRADRGPAAETTFEPVRRGRREGGGVPADLRRRFVRFRQASAPRTRIPDDLRQAVLLALGQGVSMAALREVGLTPQQVEYWRRSAVARPVQVEPAKGREGARVFEIADTPRVDERAAVWAAAGDALELRLGAWLIVIRSTRP